MRTWSKSAQFPKRLLAGYTHQTKEVDLDWDPAAAGDCLENDDDDLADDFLADLADEVLGHSEDDLDQEAAARKHHRVETDTARYTAAEVAQLMKKRKLAGNNTAGQYGNLQKHLVMFCQFEMVAGQPAVPRKKPWDKTLSGKDGPDLAAKFLSWYILEGHPGLKGKDATNFQGLSMFKRVHSMLQAVFRGRGLEVRAKGGSSDNITPQRGLLAFDVYAEVYKQCPGRAKRQKGEIAPQHLDPQDTTLAATFDRDQLVKMADTMMASSDHKDARDMSMVLAMSFSGGRGDDVRERRICELTAPMPRTCIGPAHCWVIGILQTYGKNLGGRMSTRGWIRHKDALLDVHSALGRYFVTRFTLDGEEFPDPCSEEFLTAKIWPGRKSADTAITYGGHAARFKGSYKRTGVKVKKVTHASRYHTAREADEAGLPQEDTCRFGGWRLHSLTRVYLLTALQPQPLLIM